MSVCPAETQISLGICPVWSESFLSAWRKLGSLAIHRAHSEDSDQTGQMPRLIWVFAGCTATKLVLSCRGLIFNGYEVYRKTSKNLDTRKNLIILKFDWYGVMHINNADGMANSIDAHQTALLGAVWSGSTLFAQSCLSENLGTLW